MKPRRRKIYLIEILRSEDRGNFELYLNGMRADPEDENYILRQFETRINDWLGVLCLRQAQHSNEKENERRNYKKNKTA